MRLEEFLEVFKTTSRKSSDGVFFHIKWSTSRRLSGSLPDDFQEVFQTTSRKSSRRLPGSLLTESSPMSPFHNRSERFGFTDLGLIYMFFRSGSYFGKLMGSLLGILLKYNALEVFQTTSKKSSRRLPGSLPGSLPDDFQEVF
ncbi:hypothetical protein F2Q68_00020903 [Brassica cretica]|uniref:Uncharacterized protein n=1 Tax=Brassica cretica TaxID=69181 RepID=A0A8S9G0K7_BRACR|nr:hypothetical protein F2Q68_00020903 [Brassica cretica]